MAQNEGHALSSSEIIMDGMAVGDVQLSLHLGFLSQRDFAGLAGSQRDAARSVCRHWSFGCRWLARGAAGQAAVPLLLVGLEAECVFFLLHNPGGAVVAGRAALRDCCADRLPMPGSDAITR